MNPVVVPAAVLEHLAERERHARAGLDRLHAAIAELSAQAEDAQHLLERLQLTRQTLLEITGQDPEDTTISAGPASLPAAYQDILTVLATAQGGLRAKDVCHALNLDDQPRDVENMRAKLKRLVGRDLLTEPEPGLFMANQSRT